MSFLLWTDITRVLDHYMYYCDVAAAMLGVCLTKRTVNNQLIYSPVICLEEQ
jgi:hypothetical protein